MKDTCFVLLAGGLGERLGYSGIKIAISLESITNQSYLEYYISYIKAFESKLNTSIPLVIMVSGDTSDLTHEFL
jgi:UDP-sugar pyrophosphorylase